MPISNPESDGKIRPGTNGSQRTSSAITIWFTGLSGAGKTTLARILASGFAARSLPVEVLDGDLIRENLSKGLSYSKEDRDTNVRRIGFVSGLLNRNGINTIVAAISPYRATRDEVRASIDGFVEVFVNCALDVLIGRDTKGLYRRALSGEIKNLSGISDPYEPPLEPEVTVRTDEMSPEESAARVWHWLEQNERIPRNSR